MAPLTFTSMQAISTGLRGMAGHILENETALTGFREAGGDDALLRDINEIDGYMVPDILEELAESLTNVMSRQSELEMKRSGRDIIIQNEVTRLTLRMWRFLKDLQDTRDSPGGR